MSYPPAPPPYGQPPHGQPQGGYPGQQFGGPPGPGSGVPVWVWIVAGLGILAVLAIGFILLNRAYDGSASTNSSSYSPRESGNMAGGPTAPGAVTRAWLTGQWGADCPARDTGSVYLEANGTIRGSGMSGTWTLAGNTVTTLTDGRSESSVWTYVSQDQARVSVPGVGTRTLRRCGAGAATVPGAAAAPPADPANAPARLVSGTITNDDYPAAAMRAEAQGTTAVRIEIGTDGRVTGCSVTASSGNSILDSTACSLIQRRFRYAPATRNGRPAAGSATQRVRWVLPDV